MLLLAAFSMVYCNLLSMTVEFVSIEIHCDYYLGTARVLFLSSLSEFDYGFIYDCENESSVGYQIETNKTNNKI